MTASIRIHAEEVMAHLTKTTPLPLGRGERPQLTTQVGTKVVVHVEQVCERAIGRADTVRTWPRV